MDGLKDYLQIQMLRQRTRTVTIRRLHSGFAEEDVKKYDALCAVT